MQILAVGNNIRSNQENFEGMGVSKFEIRLLETGTDRNIAELQILKLLKIIIFHYKSLSFYLYSIARSQCSTECLSSSR